MTILNFDIEKGIYSFELDNLTTESHSHPVVEIINASNGTFSIEVNGQIYTNLVCAVIDSNAKHKIISQKCTVRILMVESYNCRLYDFLKSKGILLDNGFFLKNTFTTNCELISEIENLAIENNLRTPTDKRISDSIRLIEGNEFEYKNLISELTSKVFLSESRLSHLFKEHIGISIKKYLVWNKLRSAINLYLIKKTNLTDISLQSGFFDQAHLSNSFKNFLGVCPSKAYNSRILQS